ncbi:MAG: terminase small subunit [Odoribacter splanchnicus]|nr:terminase small subunit [Odoribacter splanchnicus]
MLQQTNIRTAGMKLTLKQEAFCNYYIETGNASEAYRRAFCCAKMKPAVVNVKAVELLSNGKVSVRVKELQDELKKKSDLSKERILNELKCILDSKITDYVDLKDGKLIFKDFDELTESQIKAIESIKQGKNGLELKLHGKSWTIEQICKMLGYDAPTKQEVTGKDGKDLIPQIQIEVIDRRDSVDHEDSDD